jgi:hypothetical protein
MVDMPKTPVMAALASGRTFAANNKQHRTSWWDSAAVGITASSADSGIRVHTRARNHARKDVKDVANWRDDECDRFANAGAESERPATPKAAPVVEDDAPVCYSPCYFERRFGKRAFAEGTAYLSPRPHSPRARPTPRIARKDGATSFASPRARPSPRLQLQPLNTRQLQALTKPSEAACCGTKNHDGTPFSSREKANAEARSRCFRFAPFRTQMLQDIASNGHDAAAAV